MLGHTRANSLLRPAQHGSRTKGCLLPSLNLLVVTGDTGWGIRLIDWDHGSPPGTKMCPKAPNFIGTGVGTGTVSICTVLGFTSTTVSSKTQSCAYFPTLLPSDWSLASCYLLEFGGGVGEGVT